MILDETSAPPAAPAPARPVPCVASERRYPHEWLPVRYDEAPFVRVPRVYVCRKCGAKRSLDCIRPEEKGCPRLVA